MLLTVLGTTFRLPPCYEVFRSANPAVLIRPSNPKGYKGRIPCDTYMRTTLDPVDPKVMRKPFRQLFAEVQRGGMLKDYRFSCPGLENHYLLAIDGTGLYYSGKSRCKESSLMSSHVTCVTGQL